jgi:energy-coupling factor transporter ATP-binding protein EcfA2
MVAEISQENETIKRIGLWGAPGSGKTTFLAALNVAVQLAPKDMMLYGRDDEATDFLADHTDMLVTDRIFPSATRSQRPLSWALHTTVERPQRRWGKTVMVPSPYRLNIELLDAPGGQYGRGPAAAPSARTGLDDDDGNAVGGDDEDFLMEHLNMCDGIVLLIDPIRERVSGDAFSYFNRTLLRITQLKYSQGNRAPGRLPQYLAVCVTKFDEPDVYRMARRGGYCTLARSNGTYLPAVADGQAALFFENFCRAATRGNARLISSAIGQYFMPERVKYFITSAIGFYVEPNRAFREQDFMNTVRESDQIRIRGTISPINVVEPLLWLCQNLGTASGS